jgi:hypothetical protein
LAPLLSAQVRNSCAAPPAPALAAHHACTMPHSPLPVHIAPSILAADFARLGDDIARCA